MTNFKKMLAANAPVNSWAEDFEHENGMYNCICFTCGEVFMGHKRRTQCKKCVTPVDTTPQQANAVEMIYTNYRGETSQRSILPVGLRWGTSKWHTDPCWLLLAFDFGISENREFALQDADFRNAVIVKTGDE